MNHVICNSILKRAKNIASQHFKKYFNNGVIIKHYNGSLYRVVNTRSIDMITGDQISILQPFNNENNTSFYHAPKSYLNQIIINDGSLHIRFRVIDTPTQFGSNCIDD